MQTESDFVVPIPGGPHESVYCSMHYYDVMSKLHLDLCPIHSGAVRHILDYTGDRYCFFCRIKVRSNNVWMCYYNDSDKCKAAADDPKSGAVQFVCTCGLLLHEAIKMPDDDGTPETWRANMKMRATFCAEYIKRFRRSIMKVLEDGLEYGDFYGRVEDMEGAPVIGKLGERASEQVGEQVSEQGGDSANMQANDEWHLLLKAPPLSSNAEIEAEKMARITAARVAMAELRTFLSDEPDEDYSDMPPLIEGV